MFRDKLKSFNPVDVLIRPQIPSKTELEKMAYKLGRFNEEYDQRLFESLDVKEVLKRISDQPETLSFKECKFLLYIGNAKMITEYGDELFEFLLRKVIKSDRGSLYKALSYFYLNTYMHSSLSPRVQDVLIKNLEKIGTAWRTKLIKHSVLEKNAHQLIAKDLFKSGEFYRSFNDLHLNGPLSNSSFAIKIFEEYCLLMESKGYELKQLSRFLETYALKDENGKWSPRYSGKESLYAKALLGFWSQNGLANADTKLLCKEFLVQSFKDPRMYAQRWGEVNSKHLNVLKAWLTEESFEVLLEVLGSVADPGHWQSRKSFWTYYLKNNYITDSWVIFGPTAFHVANSMKRKKTLPNSAMYAHFDKGSSSVMSNHSVILMKIGDLVISEWTHLGKVRIFRPGSIHTPEMYKLGYDASKIRFETLRSSQLSEYEVALIHKATQNLEVWPKEVAQYIYEYTGIEHPAMTNGDY